jgi:hypothetical protein
MIALRAVWLSGTMGGFTLCAIVGSDKNATSISDIFATRQANFISVFMDISGKYPLTGKDKYMLRITISLH